MELVKYNNNSISSVTALGSLSSGDMNLITTNTISSGVSSSSFTSNIDSTYDTYLFKFINIHPATNSQHLQVDLSADMYFAGYCNVTAAIDGVDFKFASGNIDSGVIKMYGLSKS
jgi:hypothetical protein